MVDDRLLCKPHTQNSVQKEISWRSGVCIVVHHRNRYMEIVASSEWRQSEHSWWLPLSFYAHTHTHTSSFDGPCSSTSIFSWPLVSAPDPYRRRPHSQWRNHSHCECPRWMQCVQRDIVGSPVRAVTWSNHSMIYLLHNSNQTIRSPSRNRQEQATVATSILLQNASRKCRSIGAFVLCIVFSTLSLVDSGKWLANQWSAWRFQAWKVWSAPWIPGWKKLPACNHSKKTKEYHALKRNKLNIQKIYSIIWYHLYNVYKYCLTSDLCSLVTVIRNLAQV